MTARPTLIDLFCGAGGLSQGFERAGFQVLAGQDIDPIAGETFKQSHIDAVFFPGPIQQVSATGLLRKSGLRRGELDVLAGGPPCQGYSYYNHQRGVDDPRSGLFREYLRIVDGLQPKWLVMENVAGITSIASGDIVREINKGMGELGYRVSHRLLHAEDYGVPQERRRVFFIATRTENAVVFPKPTFGVFGHPFVTIWDAISDLPPLTNGDKGSDKDYASPPQNDFQREMRRNSSEVTNHSSPRLSEINLLRMKHIPPGGSWRDIPFDLLPAGMKRAKRSDHTKRYGRPRKTDLSGTILTKCDIHWGAYIHPTQDRSLSVREAARLQSFPDHVVFSGSATEQYVQVGNAVPPRLSEAVALSLIAAIKKEEKPIVGRKTKEKKRKVAA